MPSPWIHNIKPEASWLSHPSQSFDCNTIAVLPTVAYLKTNNLPINHQETQLLNLLQSISHPNIRILPPVYYSSDPNAAYDMDEDDLQDHILDIAESVARSKISKLFIINASESNRYLLNTLLCELRIDFDLFPYLLHVDDIDWSPDTLQEIFNEL